MKKTFLSLSAVLLLGSTTIGSAADAYRFTSIHIGERPQAINNLNQVVGAINSQAFYWDNGVITDLGMGENSIAHDINDNGTIVGYRASSFDSSLQSLFIYEADGSVVDVNYNRRRISTQINNNEQILIDYGNRNFDSYGAFYDNGNVSEINIDTFIQKYPYDSHFIYVKDINNSGQVIGKRGSVFLSLDFPHEGFLWQNGSNISLGDFLPAKINDSGQIIGKVDGRSTFFDNGNYVDLGDDFNAFALNNQAQILGYGSGGYQIWENGSVSYLSDLLDDTIDGWTLNLITDFNENGWIIGTATNDLSGDKHMYVLSPTSDVAPVPEADTFVLVGFGLLGFLAFHRKRLQPNVTLVKTR